MRVAIIGAKGMLGSELARALSERHSITAWDIDQIDVTDRIASVEKLSDLHPELIVNCAAWVDVDRCDLEPERAWRINAVGAQNLALAAGRLGCALVYFSTDYVFDGTSQTDYDEVSNTNPICHYGRSKLAGEWYTMHLCPKPYIVRTAWLLGHRPNNYVERVLTQAQQNGVVRMAEDQLESPTYTRDLASAVATLIESEAYGLYHVTSLGYCTRVEFARFVLERLGRKERVEIVDARTLKRVAPRPYRTVLNCRLFQLATGHKLLPWQEGVERFLTEMTGL